VIRCHTDEVIEGRLVVSFIVTTILNELMRRMSESGSETVPRGPQKELKPLGNEMSFSEIRNRPKTPRLRQGLNGSGLSG